MEPARDKSEAADSFDAFVSRFDDPQGDSGSLSGLRLAVKDNISVEGEPFTAGLPLFLDRRAERDAPCVSRLRSAGARFVGMTRTDAAGFGVVTPEVSNPVWPGHIAGGSSGGSAAAVAAGLADIGLGTDTGGSTRIPAACCGIFGFKPSQGRISLEGIWPLAHSFDTVGWMARDLATLGRAANVLLNFSTPQKLAARQLRLGIDPQCLERSADEVRRAIDALQERLTQSGARLHAATLPPLSAVSHAHSVTVLTEAKAVYPGWPDYVDRLPATARRSLVAAQAFGERDIAIAQAEMEAIGKAFEASCANFDAILTPTLPVEPPLVGQNRLTLRGRVEPIVSVLVSETCLANITGAPALSMPLPDTRVSLQLLAPRGDDARVFAIARALDSVIGNDPQPDF